MSLVEHARRELERCGQVAEDPEYADALIRAVEAFASYGHSGGSHGMAVHQLTRLLQFQSLSPLTSDPDEWMLITDRLWQSRRQSDCFSDDGGLTYSSVDDPERTVHTSEPPRGGGC